MTIHFGDFEGNADTVIANSGQEIGPYSLTPLPSRLIVTSAPIPYIESARARRRRERKTNG